MSWYNNVRFHNEVPVNEKADKGVKRTHDEVAADVAAFLAQGGEIKQLPAAGEEKPVSLFSKTFTIR